MNIIRLGAFRQSEIRGRRQLLCQRVRVRTVRAPLHFREIQFRDIFKIHSQDEDTFEHFSKTKKRKTHFPVLSVCNFLFAFFLVG